MIKHINGDRSYLIQILVQISSILVLGRISRKVNSRAIPQESDPVENISLFCGEKMNCPNPPPHSNNNKFTLVANINKHLLNHNTVRKTINGDL